MSVHTNIPLRVHIVFYSSNFNELVKPAVRLFAERVYVAYDPNITSQKERRQLEHLIKESSVRPLDLYSEIEIAFANLRESCMIIGRICASELQNGNILFVNLSGDTQVAMIGTLLTQFYKCTLYFTKPDSNGNILENPEFPTIPVKRPDPILIRVLSELITFKELEHLKSITKKDCLELIRASGIHPLTGSIQSQYNILKARFLEPLQEWNYIQIAISTHSQIEITPDGEFAAAIFSKH